MVWTRNELKIPVWRRQTTYCKVDGSTSPSLLEAHAGFFLIVNEGTIWCLFTVTFWEKVDLHIINTRFYLRLYAISNGNKKFTFSNCIFCHFKFCHNRKISSGSILRDMALKTLLCASILCFATDIFRTFGPYFLWICRACGLLIRLQKHPKQFGFQHAQCQSRFLFFSKSVTK